MWSYINSSPDFNTNNRSSGATLEERLSIMSYDQSLKSIMKSYGLKITNVTWEDTARNKNSCFGPNISDMTLVANKTKMPVIRRPNFADVTVDHTINNFNVTVGNESGVDLKRISFTNYLEEIKSYTKNTNIKTPIFNQNEKILCSTQACFLPAEKNEVNFNVRLFNYQSSINNPAVLVIIASNQGTSAMILDNRTTDIYFNKNGKAHDFIAERLKEERIRQGKSTSDPMTNEEKQRNILFIYQIPLKTKSVPRSTNSYGSIGSANKSYGGIDSIFNSIGSIGSVGYGSIGSAKKSSILENTFYDSESAYVGDSVNQTKGVKREKLGLDNAMLRVSDNDKGEFKGVGSKKLERDFNYPIRCTIQYYWITDTEKLTEPQIKEIAEQLEVFYNKSENKSSLVFSNTDRPTEPKKTETYNLPNVVFEVPLNCNV